jgi:hypothetical protein
MRTAIAVLALFTVGAAAVIPVAAEERVVSVAPHKTTIERIMALAEMDLNLRRADLGLVGAVLPATPVDKPPVVPSRVDRVHGFWAAPSPASIPTVEGVQPVTSQR